MLLSEPDNVLGTSLIAYSVNRKIKKALVSDGQLYTMLFVCLFVFPWLVLQEAAWSG